MKQILRLFTINNIILGVAIGLVPFAIMAFWESNFSYKNLVAHPGVVEDKRIEVMNSGAPDRHSLFSVVFKLKGDESEYRIFYKAAAVKYLVQIGDSVMFFTKKITSDRGNYILDGQGTVYSKNPDELFQIILKGYKNPIVDYHDYQSELKTNAWVIPVLSLLLFAWYAFSRFLPGDWNAMQLGGREVRMG